MRYKKSPAKMLVEILSDFALILLLICALLAVLFDETYLGAATLGLCVVSVGISFVFYLISGRSMEQMDGYFLPTAKVIRGGRLYRVSFENVVPGDVILLEKGDVVCGDARLVLSDALSVSMRVSKDDYVSLKKQSNAAINPALTDPKGYTNIVHAGSIIESGSARAIVYATGQYTYLGALTGGIREEYNDNVPRELKRLRAMCSRLSMIAMLCVLPFCIISLLFSSVRGGTVTLSSSFLTALAICSSAMTQLASTLCKVFFISKIRSLAENKRAPAVIRSTDAFDKMRELTHLFMLDGCALTDGTLHFETAFTADGEVLNFEVIKPSAKYLAEMATIYNTAGTESVALGISVPDRFKTGLSELSEKTDTDPKALKIRCPIRSFLPGATADSADKVFFSDTGKEAVLCVSFTSEIISRCKTALISNSIMPISTVVSDRIKHSLRFHDVSGKKILVFTLATPEKDATDADRCFIGAIVLKEGVDVSADKAISALRASGVNVVSFVGVDREAPELPIQLCGRSKAHKNDFIKNSFPLTYKFGDIDTYHGFTADDVKELIDYAHSKGETVGVIAFSNYASAVIDACDVFITVSPIVDVFSAKSERELYESESVGRGSSLSCEQSLKSRADVLLERPRLNKGGIRAIYSIVRASEDALSNLTLFLKYLLTALLIRITAVVIPTLFGSSMLDARHILLYSLIFDVPMLLLLSFSKSSRQAEGKKRLAPLNVQIVQNKRELFFALILSVATIILPIIVDFTGLVGPYIYTVEYMFFSIFCMHVSLIVSMHLCDRELSSRAMTKRSFIHIAMLFLLILIMALVKPFGLLFDLEHLPIAYFAVALVPSLAFVLLNVYLPHSRIAQK